MPEKRIAIVDASIAPDQRQAVVDYFTARQIQTYLFPPETGIPVTGDTSEGSTFRNHVSQYLTREHTGGPRLVAAVESVEDAEGSYFDITLLGSLAANYGEIMADLSRL